MGKTMPHQHATATVEVDLKTSPTWTETESHQWALKGSQQTVTPQKLMDVGDMNEKGGCGGSCIRTACAPCMPLFHLGHLAFAPEFILSWSSLMVKLLAEIRFIF